jgi:hypothetical protein
LAAVAYDEGLAERIRTWVGDDPDVREQKMFGGLVFLRGGNMAVGIVGHELLVRVGRDDWADTLARSHTREFDMTGRVMRSMVCVGVAGIAEDEDLGTWLQQGFSYADSLPPKTP